MQWLDDPQHEADVEVRLCSACDGVWLSAEALAPLCPTLSHLPERGTEVALTGRIGDARFQCPNCGAFPYEIEVLDVLVDACTRCGGVWLDAGEYAEHAAPSEKPRAPRTAYRSVAAPAAGPPRCGYCNGVLDESRAFVRERGAACPPCHYALEQRVAALRAKRGPLEQFLQRIVELAVGD